MLYVHIRIIPDQPYIVLRGQPRESSGQVFSGRIVISNRKALKVESVTATFHSTALNKSLWQQQQAPLTQAVFHAPAHQAHVVWKPTRSSAREFRFSFTVPGDMHESVATELGRLQYAVRVEMHTRGFGINQWAQTLDVPVYRVPESGTLWSALLGDSMDQMAEWKRKVALQIRSDSMTTSESATVRATGVVKPLVKGLRLVGVGLRAKERVRAKTLRTSVHERTVRECSRTCEGAELTDETAFELELEMPAAALDEDGGVQYDANSHVLRVSHELMFLVTLLDEHACPHYLSISAKLFVLPSFAVDDFACSLPSYTDVATDRLLMAGPEPAADGRVQVPPSYQTSVRSK